MKIPPLLRSIDLEEEVVEKKSSPVGSRRRRRRSVPSKPSEPTEPTESGELAEVRSKLRPAIADVTKGVGNVSIRLTLAIILQETGENEAANLLIEKYGLDSAFSLQKR